MSDQALVLLLRGVNVGSRRMEMGRLRSLLVGLGFDPVSTWLQSGNAVLGCPAGRVRSAPAEVEEAVEAEFGYRSRVMGRTASEIAQALADDPFGVVATDPKRYLIGFLSAEPGTKATEKMVTAYRDRAGGDRAAVVGHHLYLWCPNGVSQSPWFRAKPDPSVGVDITTRNWSTVSHLATMAASLAK